MAATIPTNGIVLSSGLNVADGDVVLASGHGISFAATSDGTTMSSELLDDYEEGAFTPAFSGASGAPSGVSYTTRTGSYTKIGRSVTCHIYLVLSSWSSGPSGDAIISALPFTCRNNNDSYAGISVGYSDAFTSSDGPQTGYVRINTTQIEFRTNQSNDARDDLRTPPNAGNMSGDEIVIITCTYNVD